ncbi:alpha/beta fold hydrolase [Paraburkholderia youngii]|uniref:alpha/beta fold hydrolase n=1 Tax=Paraburkholderia youngii TaxID=2782701 RepID=UPI0035E4502F
MEGLSSEFRVISVDMPGHGRSDPLEPGAGLQQFVEWAAARSTSPTHRQASSIRSTTTPKPNTSTSRSCAARRMNSPLRLTLQANSSASTTSTPKRCRTAPWPACCTATARKAS